MIVVGDDLLCGSDQEIEQQVVTLMHHPRLASSSLSFAAQSVREFAVVDPNLVQFIGSDEATTCVCLVVRNQFSGMTSVAHMDSPRVVNAGLATLLSSLLNQDTEAHLEVHVIGGFDDGSYQGDSMEHINAFEKASGYSLPLVCKIVETLKSRPEKFHLQTFCVLGHNTKRDPEGISLPIATGIVVETSTGLVHPATFDRSTRCPDEIVRRLRLQVSSLDPNWEGRLLETYDRLNDMFCIAPCSWSPNWKYYALSLQNYSDDEILHECSTSPLAESPEFIENERRLFDYMIKYPDWNRTFPQSKPRIFKRISHGWVRID